MLDRIDKDMSPTWAVVFASGFEGFAPALARSSFHGDADAYRSCLSL